MFRFEPMSLPCGRGVVQEGEHGLWYAACTGFDFQYICLFFSS